MSDEDDAARRIGEQLNQPSALEMESSAWWAMFIEHWAARGVDRRELNIAVVQFREAQRSLSSAIQLTVGRQDSQ